MLLGGREDVQDAAAHCEVAALLHQVGPGVAGADQSLHDLFERDFVARPDADRPEVAQPGDQGLQHAAYRGHDDAQRRCQRVVRVGVGQPAQHRQPLSHGVGAWRQPLVRQRLPGGEVRDGVPREQRPEGLGQVGCLTLRRGDGQDRTAGARGRIGGQGGDQYRTQRRGRDKVEVGVVTVAGGLDRLVECRVVGDDAKKSREAHITKKEVPMVR